MSSTKCATFPGLNVLNKSYESYKKTILYKETKTNNYPHKIKQYAYFMGATVLFNHGLLNKATVLI